MGAAATAKADQEVPSGATNYGRYGHEQMGRGAIVKTALRGQERKVFMKKVRTLFALVLAVATVLAMSATAFAAPADTTLKISSPVEGHTYTAYQLFVGDLSEDETSHAKTLTDVKWGSDVASSITYKVGETEKTLSPKAGDAVPKEVLDYVASLAANDQATANTIGSWVTGTGKTVGADEVTVKTGYYVIKDAYTDATADQTTTLSTFMCKVVGPTAAAPKAGTTEHKKEVLDVNDTTDTALDLTKLKDVDASKWSDSADHDFGDHVPFKLTTTIGSDFAKYNNYYLAVSDNLFDGLILDQDSIEVYVNGEKATEGTGAGEYSVTKDAKSFKVEFTKLNGNTNAAAGRDVVVYYTATLDSKTAVIGNPGNWNESFAEFSNNPNGTQEGKGKTPEDTAVVFTYKTVVDKVKADQTPLPGAEFTLEKQLKDGTTKTVAVVKSDNGTKFTFSGLDDGTYVLTETVTPPGYNTIDPITFVVSATHKDTERTGDVETLTVKNSDGTDFTGEITFTATPATGTISTAIVNQEGSTLPETGGIGTVIFYILGSLLVVGCGIVLISKRRMESR